MGRYSPEPVSELPATGERPVFGVHRLPERERTCAAWPANPAALADAAYTRAIRKAAAALVSPSCVDCGGPVTPATGGVRIRSNPAMASIPYGTPRPIDTVGGDTFRHPAPRWRAGELVGACLTFQRANPWATAAAHEPEAVAA